MCTGIKQAGSYGKGRFRTVQIQAELGPHLFPWGGPGGACAVPFLQGFPCSRPAASKPPGLLSAIHPQSLGKLIRLLRVTEGSENLPLARNCNSWTLKINCDSLTGLFRKSHTESLTESTQSDLGRSPEVQSQPRCPTSTSQESHGCVLWCCTECIPAPGWLSCPSPFPPDSTPGWVHC